VKKGRLLLFIFLLVPVASAFTFAIPEASITRTHLYRDIEESTVTFAIGSEVFLELFASQDDPDPPYIGELYYGYIGCAGSDWLEYGLAIHSVYGMLAPYLELKVDLIDMFTDSSRLSCLVMGGAGGVMDSGYIYFLYHGGGALIFNLSPRVQLYAGVGSDSLSRALNLQVGAYVTIVDWLGISANFELVTGSEGIEPMISIAPLAVIPRKTKKSTDSKE
jgi:hypothetical protein